MGSEARSSTSTSLLERAKRKDPEAWERLCDVYGPLVYRWARKAGLQDQDAADVGQEVFRTVAARLAVFRRDRPADTFRGWLWVITRNKLGDYLRCRGAQPEAAGGTDAYQQIQGLPESPEQDPATSAGLDADAGVVHRTLSLLRDQFEETTWQAFWRAAVEGHTAVDIARDLKMTPHAVRQAKYRVLRRLRHEMDEGR